MMDNFPFCRQLGIQAVVLDWDGVLVDSGQISSEAFQRVLREVGIEVKQRDILIREGQPTAELIKALLTERGISLTPETISSLVERRRAYDIGSGKRRFFPQIWDFVRRIQASGLRTALVTGSSRRSLEHLLTQEHAAALHVIVSADDVVRSKPDPEPFLLAAGRLDCSPGQCLVVENAPFGIHAARQAGCRVVGLCTTLSAEDLQGAHWIVRDHAELECLLSSSPEQAMVAS
jgi:beta-phosphoglucomutase